MVTPCISLYTFGGPQHQRIAVLFVAQLVPKKNNLPSNRDLEAGVAQALAKSKITLGCSVGRIKTAWLSNVEYESRPIVWLSLQELDGVGW